MVKLRIPQQELLSSKGRLIFFICCMFTLFICSNTGAFNLPDTGQTKCYQAMEPWAKSPAREQGRTGSTISILCPIPTTATAR